MTSRFTRFKDARTKIASVLQREHLAIIASLFLSLCVILGVVFRFYGNGGHPQFAQVALIASTATLLGGAVYGLLCLRLPHYVAGYANLIGKTVRWLSGAVIVGASILNIVLILAIIRHGWFNNDDSGQVMLLIEAQSLDMVMTASFMTIGRLFFWLTPDFITYRVVRVVADIGLWLLLYLAFWRWLRADPHRFRFDILEFAAGAGLVLMGSMSYPTRRIMMDPIGHHDLLQWSAMISVALLLLFASTNNKKLSFAAVFMIGFVTGYNVFIKITAAMGMGVLFALAVLLIRIQEKKRAMLSIVLLFAGAGVAAVVYFASMQPPWQWWQEAIELGLLRVHLLGGRFSASNLLSTYSKEILDLTTILIKDNFIFLPAAFLSLRIEGTLRNRTALRLTLRLIAGICVAIPLMTITYYYFVRIPAGDLPGYYFESSYPILALLVLVVAMIAGKVSGEWNKSGQRENESGLKLGQWAVLAVFCAVPAAIGVGSNQPLVVLMRENIWAWILVLLTLAAMVKPRVSPGLRWWVFWVLPGCLMLAQQYVNYATTYGGSFQRLAIFNYPVEELSKGRGVLFTKEEADFFRNAYSIFTEKSDYMPGDYILGLSGQSTLVYLLGGKSPCIAHYYGSEKYNFELLKRIACPEIKQSFISLNRELTPEMAGLLREKGCMFPEGYEKIGELTAPASLEIGHISIYAPRDRLR